MNFRKSFLAAVAGVALAAAFGAAIAQTVVLPTVQQVDANDLIQVIKHGMPTAQSKFATAAQVNGPVGYVRTVPLTGFSLSFAAGQTNLLLVPAGTLATGTITLAAHPGQGQLNCFRSTQTQSGVTIAAGDASQTVTGAPSAMTAAVTYCMAFDAPSSTWNLWSVSGA